MGKTITDTIQNLKNRLTEDKGVNVQEAFENPYKHTEAPKYQLTEKDFNCLFDYYANLAIKAKGGESYKTNKIIETVKGYFMGMEDFDKHKLSLSKPNIFKGLLIWGNYGIGKSMLFDIMHEVGRELMVKKNYPGVWFSSISANNLVKDYMSEATNKETSSDKFLMKYYKGNLYIDDLGFEQMAFNKTELLADVLFERHREGSITFATTNLTPKQLGGRYGARIADRMPEMFNIIKWEGQSLRE